MKCNQCKGPTIINHAGGKEFTYCRKCKIEVVDRPEGLTTGSALRAYNDMAPRAAFDPRKANTISWSIWVNRINPTDKVSYYGRSRTDRHGSLDIQYSEDGQTWGYRHSWMASADQCALCGMTYIDTVYQPLYKYICRVTL